MYPDLYHLASPTPYSSATPQQHTTVAGSLYHLIHLPQQCQNSEEVIISCTHSLRLRMFCKHNSFTFIILTAVHIDPNQCPNYKSDVHFINLFLCVQIGQAGFTGSIWSKSWPITQTLSHPSSYYSNHLNPYCKLFNFLLEAHPVTNPLTMLFCWHSVLYYYQTIFLPTPSFPHTAMLQCLIPCNIVKSSFTNGPSFHKQYHFLDQHISHHLASPWFYNQYHEFVCVFSWLQHHIIVHRIE